MKAPLVECHVCSCLRLLIRFLDLNGPFILLLPSLCVDKHVKTSTYIINGEILLFMKLYVMIFVSNHDFFIVFCDVFCHFQFVIHWHVPKLLDRLKCESRVKTTKEQIVGAHSLAHNTSGVGGRAGALRWDWEEWQAVNHSLEFAQTKQQVG